MQKPTGYYDTFGFQIYEGDKILVFHFDYFDHPREFEVKNGGSFLFLFLSLKWFVDHGSFIRITNQHRSMYRSFRVDRGRDEEIVKGLSLDIEDYLEFKTKHPKYLRLHGEELNLPIVLQDFILCELFGVPWPEWFVNSKN